MVRRYDNFKDSTRKHVNRSMPILLLVLIIQRKPAVRKITVKLGDSFSVMQ